MIASPFGFGRAVRAEYHDQAIPEFRGNPFLEALPPTFSREEAKRGMAYYPEYDPSFRSASAQDRKLAASGLATVRHPVGIHLELEERLSRLMRWGYAPRNPVLPQFNVQIDRATGALRVPSSGADGVDLAQARPVPGFGGTAPTATGLTFLGMTGIGKSVAMDMVLRLYPQLIVHAAYRGAQFTRTQVPWLHLQCPGSGSIRALCSAFFGAMDAVHGAISMDTGYERAYMKSRATIESLIPSMARLAAQHGLGVLVLDEVQDLKPRGSRKILSFLVQLANVIGVPVVLVGGYDALPILSQQFRQARRGATEGDLILGPAEPGAEWRRLCEVFWRYQYTRKESPLTSEIVDLLYEESQGITDYLAKLCKLAQIRAITAGTERVTPGVIRSILRDSVNLAVPVLKALRHGDREELFARHHDVVLPEGIEAVPFVRGTPAAVSGPAKFTSGKAERPEVPGARGVHGAKGIYAREVAPATDFSEDDLTENGPSEEETRPAPETSEAPVLEAPSEDEEDGPEEVPASAGTLAALAKSGAEEGLNTYDALRRSAVVAGGSGLWGDFSGGEEAPSQTDSLGGSPAAE